MFFKFTRAIAIIKSEFTYKKIMAKANVIEAEGEVTEALPNTMFRVAVAPGQIPSIDEKKIVLCVLSGRMRIHYVRILPGDKVKIELTPYDLERGRITYRL